MSNNTQFAKIFDAKPSQILVTKIYPSEGDGVYGIKIRVSAIIDDVAVFLDASISSKKLDENAMDKLFDDMNEISSKKTCNELFGHVYNEPF